LTEHVLNYYCQLSPHYDLNTLALYLKHYSQLTGQATDYEILKLLHHFNSAKALEDLSEHRA
jgi:hypothetical protein